MKLKHKYKFYFSSGVDHRKNMTKEDFEHHLKELQSFNTYEDFWRIFLYLKLPTKLHLKSKLFLFKENHLPIWEREENAQGGRIYLKLHMNQEANVVWQNVVLDLLTGFDNNDFFDQIINGVELSLRQADRISIALWTNIKEYGKVKEFFYNLKKTSYLPKYVEFDFSPHPLKYINNKDNQYQKN